jgi:Zn-dependent peptidase ImmA (M78 family)
MLKLARGRTPLDTVEAAASALNNHFTAEQIDGWETGRETPTFFQAKTLADLYQVPFASFYLAKSPVKSNYVFEDMRRGEAFTSGKPSYRLWRQLARLASNREIVFDCSGDLFAEYFKEVKPLPVITRGEAATSAAAKIKDYLGLSTPFKNKGVYGDAAFKHFRNIFESRGIMVGQLPGVELAEIRGASVYFESLPLVAVNKKDSDRGKVFTLIHELAHLLRHESSLCLLDGPEGGVDKERDCDKIAYEVLLPEAVLKKAAKGDAFLKKGRKALVDIADRFAVTPGAVLGRLADLGLFSSEQLAPLLEEAEEEESETSGQGGNGGEAGASEVSCHQRYLDSHGLMLPGILFFAHAKKAISYGEMCLYFNIAPIHVDKIKEIVCPK